MSLSLSTRNRAKLAELTLPQHIAIIMDGNGRYAKQRFLPRYYGHQVGAKNLLHVCRLVAATGIKYLTVYAFSSENWQRPKLEIDNLFSLIDKFFAEFWPELVAEKVRVRFIGDVTALPSSARKRIQQVSVDSRDFTNFNLTIALNYGGRQEIVAAIPRLLDKLTEANLKIKECSNAELINLFNSCLDTAEIPDPDLIIRTAGELRLSNFLLWQAAYAELYNTKCLWPEFGEDELVEALVNYSSRTRKFGAIKEDTTNE